MRQNKNEGRYVFNENLYGWCKNTPTNDKYQTPDCDYI
jgi:hypothetical protein